LLISDLEIDIQEKHLDNVGTHVSLIFLHSGIWFCVSRFPGIEITIISERRDGIVSALYFCILRRPYRIVDDKRILGIISFTADTEGLFEKVIFIHFTSTENDFYFLQCCFPSLRKKHVKEPFSSL